MEVLSTHGQECGVRDVAIFAQRSGRCVGGVAVSVSTMRVQFGVRGKVERAEGLLSRTTQISSSASHQRITWGSTRQLLSMVSFVAIAAAKSLRVLAQNALVLSAESP